MDDLQSEDDVDSHFQGHLGRGGDALDQAAEHRTAGLTAGSRAQRSVNLRPPFVVKNLIISGFQCLDDYAYKGGSFDLKYRARYGKPELLIHRGRHCLPSRPPCLELQSIPQAHLGKIELGLILMLGYSRGSGAPDGSGRPGGGC